MDIFNENIQPLLEHTGKSDAELEREIGLPRSVLYDWRNERSKSYMNYLLQIAKYLGVTPEFLMGDQSFEYNNVAVNSPRIYDFIEHQIIVLQKMVNEATFLRKRYLDECRELDRLKQRIDLEENFPYEAVKDKKATQGSELLKKNLQSCKERIKGLEEQIDALVPMERIFSPLSEYNGLNQAGHDRVWEYILDIYGNPKYQRTEGKSNNTKK